VARLFKSIKSKLVVGKLRLSLFHEASTACHVRLYFPRDAGGKCEGEFEACVRIRILDRSGVEFESTDVDIGVRPPCRVLGGSHAFQKSTLNGARCEFELAPFLPMHVMCCEAVGCVEEECWDGAWL